MTTTEPTTNARTLLVDTARHASILWQKLTDADVPDDTATWASRFAHNHLIYAAAYGFATVHALKALAEIDPARADQVAAEIDDALEDGERAYDLLCEHGQEFGVLDADGAVIPRSES